MKLDIDIDDAQSFEIPLSAYERKTVVTSETLEEIKKKQTKKNVEFGFPLKVYNSLIVLF
jgi:hypothetical protein